MSQQDGPVRSPDARAVDRVLFFSDAVFAIVLTLLVIELHPPEAPIGAAAFSEEARGLVGHIVIFAMSFALVAIFWGAHMQLTRRLAHFDWLTAWANLLFLFPITLMPFASATLLAQGVTVFSWQVYSVVLMAASLTQTLLWLVAARGGGRLMGGVRWQEQAFRTLRALSPGVAFAGGCLAAGMGRLDLAIWCWVVIVPIMLLAALMFGARHPKLAA